MTLLLLGVEPNVLITYFETITGKIVVDKLYVFVRTYCPTV